MAAVGPGIERLAEEATELFPDAKVAVLSSDLFGSARALKAQILDLAQGKADIIIGTQLVAKGHNFPMLTLVGVIDVDLGLQGSDLRAAEKTFQLMRQVSGRAGRTDKPGTAVLQTHQPEHPVIKAILEGNEDIFWHAQAAERKAAGVPPYGRFVGIVISSTDFKEAIELGQTMARNICPLEKVGAEVVMVETSLNDISADAESYRSKVVNLTGYLSDAIEPDVTWQSFTLIDNPSYLDSDHRLYVSLQGRVTEWVEAGSKVNLTGWVQWDERNYRWSIVVQSSTVEVTHPAGAKRLSWAVAAETWSYDIGKLVYVEGTYYWADDAHWIVAPAGENVGILCLIPNLNLTVNGTLPEDGFSGRLIWSEDRAQICLQMSDEDHTSTPWVSSLVTSQP